MCILCVNIALFDNIMHHVNWRKPSTLEKVRNVKWPDFQNVQEIKWQFQMDNHDFVMPTYVFVTLWEIMVNFEIY